MSVIEADWLQTSYASSRRPRVARRLAPTVRAPSMRLRSESLTGPRGSATGPPRTTRPKSPRPYSTRSPTPPEAAKVHPKRDTPYLARLSPATGGVSGDDRVCAVTALSSLPDCVPVGVVLHPLPARFTTWPPTISHEMPTSRVPSPVDALLSSRAVSYTHLRAHET